MSERRRDPVPRRRALQREIALRGAASVGELCKELGVSPATIRRDLVALEQDGFIRRAHGSAYVRAVRPAEEGLALREHKDVEAKQEIARVALRLISSGDTLLLNDGSTVMALARQIAASDLELFVVTSGMNVANVLSNNANLTVCLLGGYVRRSWLATAGPFAESMLEQINGDIAVISADSFSLEDGMCWTYPEEAAIGRKMSMRAKRTVAVLHSAKFSLRARISSVPISKIDVLVTDNLSASMATELARANVQVIRTSMARGGGEGVDLNRDALEASRGSG
ncbi:MAG: DeoR/GlpR family DNA-binding transcription regulator [Phycisphaerales bacterium]|nr:DeoR/GlpR family DNA-binding transcription regulator [Phycisphaerales bacterium]